MRKFLLTMAILLVAVSSFAGVRLKPGPQLWVFAAKGDIASVKSLVESNAFDKDVLGRAMYNSLRREDLAKSPDNQNVVKLFLSFGADTNYRALNGQTPLIAAILAKNLEAVRLLLENGADQTIADGYMKTPMNYASASPAIEALLKSPPPLNHLARVPVDPKVLNLDLSMEEATVFMSFDLVSDAPACVKIVGSLDKGATYAMTFRGATGDLGENIAPGQGKKIVWHSTVDYPSGFSEVDVLIDVVAEKCK